MGFVDVSRVLQSAAVLLAVSTNLPNQSMAFQRAGRIARQLAFSPPSTTTARQRPRARKITPSWLMEALKEEVDPGVLEGTDLRVLRYPHPSLRTANAIITQDELNDGSIAKLAKEMFMVMYAAEGVGLAAPQVGVNKRLMVYNEAGDRSKWLNEVVMVNPVITEFSEATDVETEGCLSFPDMNGEVQRSKWIKVEAINLKGKKMKKKFKGWEARIFQHEYDHLDGIVYIDRLLPESKTAVEGRLAELVQEFDGANGEPAL
jgi:peptide deformylase